MKREIKFRGKAVDDGKWLHGWLFKDVLSGVLCIAQTTSKVTKDRGHLTIHKLCKEVDPKTVGQYIGLKAKKRKEVYEGDVFTAKGNSEMWYTIKWSKTYCAFKATANKGDEWGPFGFKLSSGSGYDEQQLKTMKIIGNIHDNPELLK